MGRNRGGNESVKNVEKNTGVGRTKLGGTLDRGGTIYDGLAGTYLGQRLLSVTQGTPGFSGTLRCVR